MIKYKSLWNPMRIARNSQVMKFLKILAGVGMSTQYVMDGCFPGILWEKLTLNITRILQRFAIVLCLFIIGL